MPSEPIASRGMTGEPAANGTGSRADVGADAALVLAAVLRMQAADQEARDTLTRLRTGLGAIAETIDRAKAQNAAAAAAGHEDLAKVVDIAALLDEFEHLVDRLIEVATGRTDEPAAAPTAAELPQPAEPVSATDTGAVASLPVDADQVPTVSGVVSRLDPEQPAEPAEAQAREPAFTHASAPSVEMLKSLVEALNASIPDGTPEAEALAESPGYQATAKVMAQDVIQAFAWELTRSDAAEAPEAAAAETATAEAPPVAVAEVPEQVADLAEIAPVMQAAPEAVTAPTIEAVQEAEARQDFIAQDLEPEPAQALETEIGQQAEPEIAQAAEPQIAQELEPLVFDVLVEFDPVEPRPEAHAEAVEALAEPVEAAAPVPAAEPAETLAHPAAAGIDNDVYVLSADDVIEVETQAGAPEAVAAPATDVSVESVESMLGTAETPAPIAQAETEQPIVEIAAEPEAVEPIHAEATPEAAPDFVEAEVAATETPAIAAAPAEAAAIEAAMEIVAAEAAPVETAVLESAPIESTPADLPTMPHEASPEGFVAEQPAAETEDPVVAAVVEPVAETAPAAEAAPAEPVAAVEPPPAAATSAAADVVVYEGELMARLEQMEALPILPPELGTAVIFRPRDAQATEAAGTAELKPPAELLPTVDLDIAPEAEPAAPETAVEPEAAAIAQPVEGAASEVAAAEMLAAQELVADVTVEPAAGIVAEPVLEAGAESAPEVVAEAAPTAEIAAAPEAFVEPLHEAAAAPEALPAAAVEAVAVESAAAEASPQAADGEAKLVALDSEDDPDDFLFEPGDKATTSTNGAEAAPGELATAAAPAVERAAAIAPAKPAAPADPLIPIKAMSPEERIALFS